MYLTIIILPLLSSIATGFFGRKVGVSGAHLVGCCNLSITTILALIAFFEVGFNNMSVNLNLFRWLDSEWFNIFWNFEFNNLTVSMLIPVLIISSLVHIYSVNYMSNDPHNQRFFSFLSLFTFMMIILVTTNNYLSMFVGWEGVGVCSYLLVSFWFTRIAANQSSMSAFLTNRVGDCLFTIGMFAILWSLGNLDYSTIFSLTAYINVNIITIIGICLLIGAMAKSSQLGLHIWLPMAMEGPTPVSALIHAATMVTAGVYLLMRSSPLIEYSSTILLLCLWLGAMTTVFSSLIGLFQQDLKKVIAYSTMSQLGMMVIAIGLSSYNLALFHLINHAFYKGLLFLGAGSVIHAVVDNQDFRKYGGLIKHLPITYSVMLIASLSLVAIPFMTGFYSKDFILESAYGQFSFSSITVYFIAAIGAIFTTLYSVKVLYLTFLANPNGSITYYKNAHEGNIFLTLPLIILGIFSIYFGYMTKDIFIGLGSNFFIDNSLFVHPLHEIMIDTEFSVATLFKWLPFIFTITFSVIALILSELLPEIVINFKYSRLGYIIFGFFNQRFLVEFFYNKYIVNMVLGLGGQTTNVLDRGSIEYLGPFGLDIGLTKMSKNISWLSASIVTNYALYILIAIIGYLLFSFFQNINIDLCLLLLLIFSLFTLKNINNKNTNDSILESNIFAINFKCFHTSSKKKLFNNDNQEEDENMDDDDDDDDDDEEEEEKDSDEEEKEDSNNEEEEEDSDENMEDDSDENMEDDHSEVSDGTTASELVERFEGNPQEAKEYFREKYRYLDEEAAEQKREDTEDAFAQDVDMSVEEYNESYDAIDEEVAINKRNLIEKAGVVADSLNMENPLGPRYLENREETPDESNTSENKDNSSENLNEETKDESNIPENKDNSSENLNEETTDPQAGSSRNRQEDNLSPVDYVIDKESTEMPSIIDSDGGD